MSAVASTRGSGKPLTPGRALRQFCRWCLILKPASKGYDCLNTQCTLYCASPYRGRAMPQSLQYAPNAWVDEYAADLERQAAEVPRRRPSLTIVRRYCRECRQGAHEDCGCPECLFYGWLRYGRAHQQALPGKSGRAERRLCAGTPGEESGRGRFSEKQHAAFQAMLERQRQRQAAKALAGSPPGQRGEEGAAAPAEAPQEAP